MYSLPARRLWPPTGISDSERETPLHHAARLGHATLVSLLCENNAPLEAVNAGGATSLHIASYGSHLVALLSRCDAACLLLRPMLPLRLLNALLHAWAGFWII